MEGKYINNREIIVFGAGKTGEQFIYSHFADIKICCFWDNQKTGELLGYQILKPQPGKQVFIIVASLSYLEIRRQLAQMGYHEFLDFIPYQIFGKKIAVAYGNCHMEVVKIYLERDKEFASNYGFYPLPMVQQMKNMPWDFGEVLHRCVLFFHQSIRRDNLYGEQYSSECMLQHLAESCTTISIPNLYGMPKYLFPQLDMNAGKVGAFHPFFIDRNIALWIKAGKRLEKIKSYILKGGAYSKSEIKKMWEDFQIKLFKREKEWDIKISDYILSHQSKLKLFSDPNHITSKTAHEISNRILEYMGYDRQIGCELPLMDDLEAIIYEDVREALELEFEETYLRKYQIFSGICIHEMDRDEYIEQMYQYIRFCLENGFYQ